MKNIKMYNYITELLKLIIHYFTINTKIEHNNIETMNIDRIIFYKTRACRKMLFHNITYNV